MEVQSKLESATVVRLVGVKDKSAGSKADGVEIDKWERWTIEGASIGIGIAGKGLWGFIRSRSMIEYEVCESWRL